MKPEDAKIALEEARKTRLKEIESHLRGEKKSWDAKYKDYDFLRYSLETDLFHELCEEFSKLENLGKNILIVHPVNKTRFSGDKYINLEQLMSVLIRAGLNENNINIYRNFDKNQTCISIEVTTDEIDYSSENIPWSKIVRREKVAFNMNELDYYINHGHPNWLVNFFREYLMFRSTEPGRALTEKEMAMAYYDRLTDKWHERIKAIGTLQPPMSLSTNLPKEILKEEFGDIQNVLKNLETLMDETGFKLLITDYDYNEMGHNIPLCIEEKDHILDNEQGIAQTLL